MTEPGRAVRDHHPAPEPWDFLLGERDKSDKFANVQLFGPSKFCLGKTGRLVGWILSNTVTSVPDS